MDKQERTRMKNWDDRRLVAYNQAISELGELCESNLGAIQKRVKELLKVNQKGK